MNEAENTKSLLDGVVSAPQLADTRQKHPPQPPRGPIERARRFASKHLKQFDDNHYILFDRNNPPSPADTLGLFKGKPSKQYDKVQRFAESNQESLHDVSNFMIRIPSFTCHRIATEHSERVLTALWPFQVDSESEVIDAKRHPLGQPAKIYLEVGATDIYGNVIEPGEQGWCSAWQYGLQIIPGAEGTPFYQVRPMFKVAGKDKFGFKLAFKAVVQVGNGKERYAGVYGVDDVCGGYGASQELLNQAESTVDGKMADLMEDEKATRETQLLEQEMTKKKGATMKEEATMENLITMDENEITEQGGHPEQEEVSGHEQSLEAEDSVKCEDWIKEEQGGGDDAC